MDDSEAAGEAHEKEAPKSAGAQCGEWGEGSFRLLTSSASRMGLHKQTPEASLGAEVDHQTPLLVDTHAGWVQGPCGKTTQTQQVPDPVLKPERD